MFKKILVILGVLFLTVSVFAEYKADAYKAYKAGNLQAAAALYKKAQEAGEIPKTEKWNSFISNLERKVSRLANLPVKKKDEDSAMPWIVGGIDLALAGLGAYFTIAGLNAKTEYEKQYDLINNTNIDNYNTLVQMKKDAEGKLNLSLIIDSVAGAAIIYTIADVLFLHMLFPETKMVYEPKTNEIKVTYNKEF